MGILTQPGPGNAQTADFPLKSGEAVATCFSGYKDNSPAKGIDLDAFVVAVVDVRTPPAQGAVPGQHWSAPMYHNEDTSNPTGNPNDVWTAGALGQVFGIALDDASSPSIFVGASSTYFPIFQPDGTFADGSFGPLGSGGVYRLDGATGAICEHARLHEDVSGNPLQGPALGNLAYDRVHDQLFVSSFEDGRIVRLPASSPCNVLVQPLGSFDHGVDGRSAEGLAPIPDDGATYQPSTLAASLARTCQPIPDSGFTPLGRRVWGLQVHEGRLYYSVWNEDQGQGRSDPNAGNEIWSIGLLPGGDFDKQDVRRETEILPLQGRIYSNPVSDIAFSADGRMLLAERVRCRDHGVEGVINAHSARVLEYERQVTGGYGKPIREIPIGLPHNNLNAAGGVDYGYEASDGTACDQTVWATGDTLLLSPQKVYGLQGTPDGTYAPASGALQNSFYIDLNRKFDDYDDKTEIGDVEVARNDCLDPPCLDQVTFESLCVVEDGAATGDFTWRFRLRNESGGPIYHLFLNDLPPGVSADPDHLVFDPPIPNGHFGPPQTVTLTGVSGGTVLELGLSIHDAQLAECCAEKVTVELPDCECAQIVSEQRPACFSFTRSFSVQPPYRYRVDLQNLSGRTAQYFFAAAVDPGDLSTPILPGDLTVHGSGALANPATPGQTTGSVNFLIDGPGATPGREVCLFLNLSDPNLRSCCSIPRCFTLPDCTINPFVGPPQAFDGTTLDFVGGEIVLSGFDDGVGGIDVEIPGADRFAASWAPIDPVDGQGAEIRVSTFGFEDEELATVEARELGGGIQIRAAFLQQRDEIVVEVLNLDGFVVTSQPGRSDRVAVTLESWPAGFVMEDNLAGIIILGHEDTLSIRLPDGTRSKGTAIRIRDANRAPSGSFARAALRVEGLDELRLRTLQAIADCDGDAVPDDEAIAGGLVEDLNGDGVPDRCRPLQSIKLGR